MKQTDAYREVLEFLNSYVEYYLQIPEDYVDEDGRPSTAAELQKCLKLLPKKLPKRHRKSATTSKPVVKKEKMSYVEWLNNPDFKDYIYTVRKEARESINPNYRYCVINDDVDECYLTDDIGVAMEFAANKSKTDAGSWNVCKIVKAGDGSYITTVEGHCMRGHYIDDDRRTFLHFDYIAQRCGEIHKIP